MPKPIEIDINKLHMKFSALNVDFDSPGLDFLRKPQGNLCTKTTKSGIFVKVASKWLEID